jgi:hypothetical protein
MGSHSGTKNSLPVVGWEEWDLDADYKVKASRGWYDTDEYKRQTGADEAPGPPEVQKLIARARAETEDR